MSRCLLILLALFLLPRAVSAAPCSSIDDGSSGITITLDTTYTCGVFADGETWVVENSPGVGVNITAMTPVLDANGFKNGYDINPLATKKNGNKQSLTDSGIPASGDPPTYTDPEAKYGPENDLDVMAGETLIKVKGKGCQSASNAKTCIEDAISMTVLATDPTAGGCTLPFRPPYSGAVKTIYCADDINWSLLGLEELVASGQLTIATVLSRINAQGVYLDHGLSTSSRYLHTLDRFDDLGGNDGAEFGAEYAVIIAAMMLRTLQKDDDGLAYNDEADKILRLKDIVYPMIQLGIDTYHGMKSAGWSFPADGAVTYGRMAPVMYAGALLGESVAGMKDPLGVGGLNFAENRWLTTGGADGVTWGKDANSNGCPPQGSNPTGVSTCPPQPSLRDGGWAKFGCAKHLPTPSSQDELQDQRDAGCASLSQYQVYTHMYLAGVAIPTALGLAANLPQKMKDYTDRIFGEPWDSLCSGECNTFLPETYGEFGTGGPPAEFLNVVASPDSGPTDLSVTLTATPVNFTVTTNVDFDCTGDQVYDDCLDASGPPFTCDCAAAVGALTTGSYTLGASSSEDDHTGSDEVTVNPAPSLDVIRVELWEATGGEDAIDDFLAVWENGQTYTQQCLGAWVIIDPSCDSLKYDWIPPGVSEVVNARSEVNEPYGIPGEFGMHDDETPDLRCDIEISPNGIPLNTIGTHQLTFTCCSVNWVSGSCSETTGTPFIRSLTITPGASIIGRARSGVGRQ